MIKRVLKSLGPGMIMAATAIGAGDMILSPVAGARYGFDLMWLVLFAHLFKYPAFEFAPRFAIANGHSLITGYYNVPGPKGWALWIFLVTTTLQGLTITTGLISVTASVAFVSLGGIPYPAWIVALGLFIMLLHKTGKYHALDIICKVMLGILAVVTAVAFITSAPRASDLARMLVPSIPAGSVLLASSIFGLAPTGINVSIWHSLWVLEHVKYWEKTAKNKADMFRMSLIDFRVGYWFSAIIGMMFMALGANELRPRGLTPDGVNVAVTLSRIYTELIGPWMYGFFMLAVFAAMFSSTYSVLDGFPRAFSNILRTLAPDRAFFKHPKNFTYWGFMIVIVTFATIVTTLLPNPVLLVSLVGALSLLIAPVLYSLNYYCATRLINDPSMRPPQWKRIWAILGILCMAAAGAFSVYTEIFLRYLAR